MKSFLILILFISIACEPSILNAPKDQRLKIQKRIKEKLIKCIDENASQDFKNYINRNEEELRLSNYMKKEKINKEDKKVIKECRKKAFKKLNEEIKK